MSYRNSWLERSNVPRRAVLSVLAAGLGAAILLWPTASSPAQAGALETIKERGSLRVAGVVYRPFMIRRPDGSYEGIDVDAMGQIASDLGVKLEFVDSGWDTAVAGITTGKWDVVPAICITPERLKAVDFSESYLMLGGVLGVRADNDKINSVEDANKPEVRMSNVAGSWSDEIANKAFPLANKKSFGQATDLRHAAGSPQRTSRCVDIRRACDGILDTGSSRAGQN